MAPTLHVGEVDDDRWERSRRIEWLDLDRVQRARFLVVGAGALGNEAVKDLVLAGPAPAPLLRAETYYRYQIMLRAQRMAALSQRLALLTGSLTLPEDVTLAVDIDPVDLT